MALSTIDWVLWAGAMIGLAALWFEPQLPIGVAGAAALAFGAYLFYIGGFTWQVGAALLLGVGAVSIWLVQRYRGHRERSSNL